MIKCECPDYDMFKCWDCAVCTNCTGEYYMVDDELWKTGTIYAHDPCFEDVMLCIGCLENRIGGLLTKDDFTAAPLNSINLIMGSPRLQNRLTNGAIAATF